MLTLVEYFGKLASPVVGILQLHDRKAFDAAFCPMYVGVYRSQLDTVLEIMVARDQLSWVPCIQFSSFPCGEPPKRYYLQTQASVTDSE